MKDSGLKWVGQIPAGWEVSRLKRFVSQVKNRNTGTQETNLLSLSYGRIKRKSMETVSGLVPESYAGYNIIEADDIVLRLTDLQNDKHSIRVGRSTERGIVTSAYVTIRPTEECHSPFLAYAILGFDIVKGFYGIGSGVRQGLTYDEVKKLLFFLPPLPEQRAIAARLDALTGRIESESKKIAAEIERLEQYKKSFITEAVCGRCIKSPRPMKDSGIPWVGKIPEEWGVRRLKYLLDEVNDYNDPLTTTNVLSLTNDKGVIPYSERGNAGNKPREDLSGYKLVYKDCIVANSMNIIIGSVGLSCYDGCVTPVYYVFRAKENVCINYINHLFQTRVFQRELRRFAKGILEIRLRISSWSILNCKIPLPPLAEQHSIAAAIDATCAKVDAIVAKRKRQLDRLDALKRSLVYEYVTGKKEVKVEGV